MVTFKFYDTSSLLILRDTLFDENKYSRFGISSVTLKELESIKVSTDKDSEIKYAARKLLSALNENFDKFDLILYKPEMLKPIKEKGLEISNDMKILASAIFYDNEFHPDETIFVTNDMNLRSFANLFFGEDSIEVVGYHKSDDYKGYIDVTFDDNQMCEFYSNQCYNTLNAKIGEYIIIRDKDNLIVDKLVWTGDGYRQLKYAPFTSKWFGTIKPAKDDVYQAFAADSLMHNQLTMLKGPAGSGKTYLSLGYLFSKLEKGDIDRIVVFCNTVATRNSAKLGFYPGTRDEKLLDSQIGNLLTSKIGGRVEVERLIEEDRLVLLPLSDIRGYETPDRSGVYISEAQNLDIDMMQLALTRISADSICVIDGDDKTQVDLPAYAGEYNGMKKVSKVYRGHNIYGEVELHFVHRSVIADLARQLSAI